MKNFVELIPLFVTRITIKRSGDRINIFDDDKYIKTHTMKGNELPVIFIYLHLFKNRLRALLPFRNFQVPVLSPLIITKVFEEHLTSCLRLP